MTTDSRVTKQADWREVAAARRRLVTNWKVARAYSTDNEEVGACGEWTFAVEFDLRWTGHLGAGDRGVDFMVEPFTIDVKTAATDSAGAAYLLHEAAGPQSRQSQAVILVAARYTREKQTAHLVGWHWRSEVEKQYPLLNFGAKHKDGSLVMSHAMRLPLLSIESLHRELAR